MATDPRRLYREIVEVEKQLRELLRANPLNSQDANVLRSRLVEKAKAIADVSPAFAASKEIEQALWKPCFYKRIEDFRRRIRKYASAPSNDRSVREHFARVSTEFQRFLNESSAFYEHLRDAYAAWLSTNRVSRIASNSAPSFTSNVPAGAAQDAIPRCRQSLHRCFIFLGDLARYRELHSQKAKKNFAAAESFYYKALALLPENGNPHNQLAVLATYVEAETVAVYRYCRSLLIAQPFATAEENLALLFERSRQRPLAAPSSMMLTGATSSKDKSAFLKSFLHRLTRMHGILFSTATRPSSAGNNGYGSVNANPVYPRDMEAVLCKDLDALLRAGVVGDALLLKVVVTNVFCLVRAMRGNTSAKEDSLRLSTLTISNVIEYLVEELGKKKTSGNDAEIPNSLRLLGPVSVFCDFMRLNPKALNVLESAMSHSPISETSASAHFASAFLESLTSLLNHAKLKEMYAPLVNLRNDQQEPLREQQLLLKENIELRGFSPFAALLESSSTSASAKWKDDSAMNSSSSGNAPALAENEAVKIRAWNLYHFGKFLCEEYEGNPLLYLYQGTFSTSPTVGAGSSNGFLQAVSGTRNTGAAVSQVPSFDLGLFGAQSASDLQKPAKRQPDEDDDDFDDEVIVFQPSPALTPAPIATSGSSALRSDINSMFGGVSSPFADLTAAGPFSLGGPSSQTTPDPTKRNSFSDSFGSFGGSGSFGSTLGYPNFQSFNDFGSFSGQGLLSGWGNSNSLANSSNNNALGKPPSVPKLGGGLGGFGGSSSENQFAPLMDLVAVERESALYQQEESSLSAFFSSSQRSTSSDSMDLSASRTSPRPPPPPGFGSASLGMQSSSQERRGDGVAANKLPQQQQQPQFYTRNPFINP
uniref:DNA/RNA-binding domain-containing protein n=1 Tax=Globisporangium ultimum (strain ATCC 200006 / CBS 805.95 / DAOM BR144) TaxID=431595 RepID=K3X593_GLOUD